MMNDHSNAGRLPITGAVLAGGMSTRMGQDKASLIMADGQAMIQHVIGALSEVCTQVVTVGPHEPLALESIDTLRDMRPGCGPLAGMEALLASGIDPCGEYLVCACDMPLISADLLRTLTVCDSARAAVFHVRGRARFECMPVRISSAALHAVRDHLDRGDLAVWRLIAALDPRVISIDESQAMCLRNVNTPDEFAHIANTASATIHPAAR